MAFAPAPRDTAPLPARLYAFSGLGADGRVFGELCLPTDLIVVDWIVPRPYETISDYALRLLPQLDLGKPFALLGVSFGGVVALEVARYVQAACVIQVSSVATPDELPVLGRLAGALYLDRYLPEAAFDPPRRLAGFAFGASDTALLNAVLDDTDLRFAKWAVGALLRWRNDVLPDVPIFRIKGTADRVLPGRADSADAWIANGGHFMVADRVPEVSVAIEQLVQ